MHGLTREKLRERGARPLDEVWRDFEDWLNETVGEKPLVWAAHNGDSFDRPILVKQVGRSVGGSPLLQAPRASWVDTLHLSRESWRDGHTLGSLYASANGGCHVYPSDDVERPPGMMPPAKEVQCPPLMLAPEWGLCTDASTLATTAEGDACICSPSGNPPPPSFRTHCPKT